MVILVRLNAQVMFAWRELGVARGNYVVGFIVEDLDGNAFEVYEQVVVE
jgi:hypothetical protein